MNPVVCLVVADCVNSKSNAPLNMYLQRCAKRSNEMGYMPDRFDHVMVIAEAIHFARSQFDSFVMIVNGKIELFHPYPTIDH